MQVWLRHARLTRDLPCLAPFPEGSDIMQVVCTAMLASLHSQPFGLATEKGQTSQTLPQSWGGSFKEEHLQPVLTDRLQTALSAAQSDCILLDTHKPSSQLSSPIAQPCCTLVAAGEKAAWTQVVCLFDFSNRDSKTDLETSFGQQVERCCHVLDAYSESELVVAVNITRNSLEVVSVERAGQKPLQVTRTGRQPFSISAGSPGLQLLVRCLLTPKSQLGFVTCELPAVAHLSDCSFTVMELIKQGSASDDCESWAFLAKLQSGGGAALKLRDASTQVRTHYLSTS